MFLKKFSSNVSLVKNQSMVSFLGLAQVADPPLSMRDVAGSIPGFSIRRIFIFLRHPFYSVKSSFYPFWFNLIEEANTIGGKS